MSGLMDYGPELGFLGSSPLPIEENLSQHISRYCWGTLHPEHVYQCSFHSAIQMLPVRSPMPKTILLPAMLSSRSDASGSRGLWE